MILRPGQPMERDVALRLSVMVEKRARADACAWHAGLARRGTLVARGRAGQVIDGTATSTDPLRTHIMQEWYVRVFDDELRTNLGRPRSKTAVTPTETEHVAECLRQGVAFRILGPGGSAVLNHDSAELVPGQAGFTDYSVPEDAADLTKSEDWHRRELEKLAEQQDQRRREADEIIGAVWDNLSPEQRADFAAYWHQLHLAPPASPQSAVRSSPRPHELPEPAGPTAAAEPTTHQADPERWEPLTGSPREAAAAVFDHDPPSLAELNAARELAAQDFPRRDRKPPKINRHGTERHGVFIPQPLEADPPSRDAGR